MLPLETVSRFSPVRCVSARAQQVALHFLLPGILLAGAATSGFALAGYLPSWNTYLGISVDLAVAGIILAAHYFKPKRVFEDKQFPIEIKKEFLKYLSLKDLGNAALVCQSWNSAVQTLLPSKLRSVVESMGWRGEDNVDGLKAYQALTCLGMKKKPKQTESNIDFNVSFTTHFFSANHWICVVAFAASHEGLENVEIKVWEVNTKNDQLDKICARKFENINRVGVGIFGNTIYIPSERGDVILWNFIQDTCETWKNVHDLIIQKITVTDTHIMTYSLGTYKLWTKDLTLVDQKLYAIENHAVVNGVFFAFHYKVESDYFAYKDSIIYRKCESSSSFHNAMASMPDDEIWKIVSYNPEKQIEETIIESKNAPLLMKHCGSMLLIQSSSSLIKMYDLRKKRWLQPLDGGKNFKFEGAFAGIVVGAVVKADEWQLKTWDFR